MNKQREKTEQGIERREGKSRMEYIESGKEHWKEHNELITEDFKILD